MLNVKKIGFSYGKKEVLKNISFELAAGESVCLLGKNGVGKSTLFRVLLGIYPPSTGHVCLNGKDISSLSRKEIASLLSYIPQNHKSSHQFTVFEMILLGRTAKLHSFQLPGKEDYIKVEEALNLLNICSLRNRIFCELSGGEQQLVIIARSVAQESRIFIMDEPCGNLDYSNQLMVLQMIRRLTQEGYLIIQSTHDPNHALQYGDKVLLLQKGELITSGHPQDVLTSVQLSKLYQADIEVCSLKDDRKVCLPSQDKLARMEDVSYVENV